MADKPTSTSYHQVSFGTIEVSTWSDGRRTARIRLDPALRSPPVRFDGEDHAVAKASRIDNPDGTPHHWELDVT